MNVWGVTFGGCLAKILSFKLGNLLYKSNFYLLSEGTVMWGFQFHLPLIGFYVPIQNLAPTYPSQFFTCSYYLQLLDVYWFSKGQMLPKTLVKRLAETHFEKT